MAGFVRFTPQPIVERSPPQVFLEDVLINGGTLLPGPGVPCPPQITIPPGRPRVDFHFAALDLSAPEDVHFRYRLVGLDENWVDAGTRRVASFSRLPPGHYRFEVSAASGGSGWNAAPAALPLILRPHFWETPQFYAGSALFAALVVIQTLRVVAKRRAALEFARLERKRAVDAERARISKDLHDDLGANLTQIALLSELAKADLGRPAQVGEHLEQIFTSAQDVARTMDEIVWAVNPAHDTLDSFIAHIVNLAQDLARSAGLRFRIEAPVQLPATPLSTSVQHHLYLAVKEAMHNVIRHAAATQLRLGVTIGPEHLTIVVEDDGRGFDPTSNSVSHGADGWLNLPARMTELGGKCLRRSAPGAGTTVELRVPLAALPR
jgi:signal transduction histidine kinase